MYKQNKFIVENSLLDQLSLCLIFYEYRVFTEFTESCTVRMVKDRKSCTVRMVKDRESYTVKIVKDIESCTVRILKDRESAALSEW